MQITQGSHSALYLGCELFSVTRLHFFKIMKPLDTVPHLGVVTVDKK